MSFSETRGCYSCLSFFSAGYVSGSLFFDSPSLLSFPSTGYLGAGVGSFAGETFGFGSGAIFGISGCCTARASVGVAKTGLGFGFACYG